MIPQKVERNIIRGGDITERKMGIDATAMPHILKILRQGIYSDPIISLIREYVTNAIDEHVKLNKLGTPVVLQLPNAFAPELRVRDFGAGLLPAVYSPTCLAETQAIEGNKIVTKVCGGNVSVKNWDGSCDVCGEYDLNLIGVYKYFGQYGASDKRESNELIGAFGIGCKSAFAYTDSFSVIAFKDGMKWTFNVYLDETGNGSVAKLTEQTTDEGNGLEIVVPVKQQDISTFVSRGYDLVKYLKTKPTLKGVNNPPSFERAQPALSGKSWRYFGDSRDTILIQGQIGYPVDSDKVGQVHYGSNEAPKGFINEWEYSLLESGIELDVNIGEVEVTASREQLMMSDYTIAAIRKRLAEVKAEIQNYAEDKLKSAKTMIEAKTAFYELFLKGGSFGHTLKDAIGEVKWNGMTIKDNVIQLDESLHKVMMYETRRNGNVIRASLDRLKCSADLNLYFDDTDRREFMYRRRAKTLLDAGATKVVVIQSEDVAALKKETGIDSTKLPQYSTVTPTVLNTTRVGTGIDASKRAKHQVKLFSLDTDKLMKGYVKGSNSNYWKVASIVPDKQVYIPIERFIPQDCGVVNLQALKNLLDQLKSIGAEVTIPIYGVKPNQSVGNMVKFDVWLKDYISKIPNLADEAALIGDFSTSLTTVKVAIENLPEGSVAKKYKEVYMEARKLTGVSKYGSVETYAKNKVSLAALAGLKSKRSGELPKLAEEFDKMYPLVKKAMGHQYYYQDNPDVPFTNALTEYIQLIFDSKEK
jgi:hypothetical protein